MTYSKDAEMTLVCGRRGAGKTTLTKGLIKDKPKVVVFDPRAEYAEAIGAQQVKTLHALIEAMQAGWSKGFKVCFVPRAGQAAVDLHRLCSQVLIPAQHPYDMGNDPRKLTLVIDEMATSFPKSELPGELYGMYEVCNQGRHVGIEPIGITQLPQAVSTTFRTNCRSTYSLAMEPEGRRHLEKKVEGEGPALLAGLQPFEFMHMRDGKFELGRVKKSGEFEITRPFP
jgi:energy-coupling factor transporter ATP-binding protein EcfA2